MPDPFLAGIIYKAMGWAVVCIAVLVTVGVMLGSVSVWGILR